MSATPSVESYARGRQGTFARGDGFSFSSRLAKELRRTDGARWPDARYAADPVGFVQDVLHEHPWARQVELLEAVRDHKHVAIKSGHKIGKSRVLAWIALWWFCTHEDARVLFTSSVERQVDDILWRELVLLIRRSGIALDCRPAEHAKTGLVAPDRREIKGLSAREAEAAAGTSGVNVLYLVDEASGCTESLFAAFEGNLAGGGRMVLASNPTRTHGKFFSVFEPKEQIENGGEWKTLTAASTETPNAISGKSIVPGLATREWCEARKANWGETSIDYKVRVKGEFPINEERKILTLHEVLQSQKRWEETNGEGPMRCGFDVAGAGGGDESVMAFRRGSKITHLFKYEKMTKEIALANLLGHRRDLCREGEPLIVAVDAEGFGWTTYEHLAAYALEHPDELVVIAVHAGHRAQREPGRFDRTRDEIFARAEQWVREGGALYPDQKLQQEAHAAEWERAIDGKLKATPKKELKAILGRSPDSWDAVCLAVWEEDSFEQRAAEIRSLNANEARREKTVRTPRLDPYSAETTWRTR